MSKGKFVKGPKCDRCGRASVCDLSKGWQEPERWLCRKCIRRTGNLSAYTVNRPDGAEWVQHLMRLRARAESRLPLFGDEGEARDQAQTQ